MTQNRKQMTKSEKKVLIIMLAAAIIAVGIFAGLRYVNDYYVATDKGQKAILGNSAIQVTETEDYYRFELRDGNGVPDSGKGIVFYPGGKVDEVAYAPLMSELAEEGYRVYLVKMPAKLAILGAGKATDIIEANEDIREWTMMGHSLGGAMAASYAADHREVISNLVLLAAYSTEDLSAADIDVYSFYGSEDKVLNMASYEKYMTNLPADMVETVIPGGNHSYYAHYGEQDGDGTATITREEQQETVLDIFLTLEREE